MCLTRWKDSHAIILGFTLLLLSFASPSICTAIGQPQYYITEAELTRLETNLSECRTLNKKQSEELILLRSELSECRTALMESQKQLTLARTELSELRVINEQSMVDLQNAKASLQRFDKEAKAKIKKYRMQRDLAYCIGIGGILIRF